MIITPYDHEKHACPDEHGRAVPPHGAYTGMPMGTYHGAFAFSQGDLRAFAADQRTFLKGRTPQGVARKLQKLATDDGDTEARRVGRYVHFAVSQPHEWAAFRSLPSGWALNEAHKQIVRWRRQHPGKTPVRAKEYLMVVAVADALKRSGRLADVLAHGVSEISIFWQDRDTGLEMKARPDLYDPSSRTILDLKTTEETSTEAWRLSARKYRYDLQAAHYGRAVESTGDAPRDFQFAVVMKEDFDPGVFFARMTGQTIVRACDFLDAAARRVKAAGFLVPELPVDVVDIDLADAPESVRKYS